MKGRLIPVALVGTGESRGFFWSITTGMKEEKKRDDHPKRKGPDGMGEDL